MTTLSEEIHEKYLNQMEAAQYLRLSKATISLLTSRGELPHYRINRSVRYTKQDLDNFMESHKISVRDEELGRKGR